MKNDQITHSFCEQVLDRLSRREKLAEIARVVVDFESAETLQFLQEKDEGGVCPGDRGMGYFVCNSFTCPVGANPEYACPGDFQCTGANTYSDCGGTNTFQCNQTQTTDSFSCKQGTNTADYFDCRTFVCGQEGNSIPESFDCNSVVDFICGGPKYDCVDKFDCTAGHGFFCFNNHGCDQFECAGGTVEGCGDPPVAVSCTPGNNVSGYGMTGGRDGNDDPGDFHCAARGGIPDIFDCHKNFDCKAKSDFSCQDTGDFTCAQQGGDANNFECHSSSPFLCASNITCASASLFECGKDGAEYKCASYTCAYAECQSQTEKECKSDYRCNRNHDCNVPGFVCAVSGMYNCVKNIPPFFDPSDPFG